ncbi:MAG: SDR family oxidoreductase [Gemmatimonadales bacterium]|nr:MAG: SDR family oxidoreductase [Gemmatimonadales bacterium]
MKVLVVGANGLTGRRLVRFLAHGPHEPVALVRDPKQAPTFEELGVPVRVGDLEAPLDEAVVGMDAVIFVAGSGSKTGPDKTLAVDRDGAIRLIAAMEAAGVPRYVMLSSRGADPESRGHALSSYLRAKGIADAHLRRSELEWTILRPGRLTEDEGTGLITVSRSPMTEGHTTRDTLARVLARCLDEPATLQATLDMAEGGRPVDEALRGLAS